MLHEKESLMDLQKSVNSGQPAQSVQTDLGRNFLFHVGFLHDEVPA